MWDYTDEVLEHFMNPRNIGTIEDADGVGEVGSMACGDALRLSFKLDENERIVDAKFQTFGCGSAIASSSMLTEMLKGKTLDEAARITNEDIAHELGGLPREKMHCSVMGREALEAAMLDYYKRLGKGVPCTLISQDEEICHCFQVKKSTIKSAVLQYRLTDVEDVTHYTKAGGGCTQCHAEIEEIIKVCRSEFTEDAPSAKLPNALPLAGPPTTPTTPTSPMSPAPPADTPEDERTLQIRELLENDVARALRTDGGDLELVGIDGDEVRVKLTGACASCPSSQATIKGWVEAQLREHIDEKINVVEVVK